MTDPEPTDDIPTAQQMGESLAALMGNQEWVLDTPPEVFPDESIVDANMPPEPPPPPPSSTAPPVAEAANEPTIPPTPLQIMEALLFVGGPALTFAEAADAIRGLSHEQFREAIDTLNRVYRAQHRPYEIVHHNEGFTMRLAARHASIREKLYGGPREARLNQTALDVLALIAYRQPVGKAEIDAIRGADSAGIMRQLVRLGLIAIIHRDDSDPKNAYYGTTPRFLEVFRLRDIDDLPKLGEAKKLA
jgi:segregation and condensation protein B